MVVIVCALWCAYQERENGTHAVVVGAIKGALLGIAGSVVWMIIKEVFLGMLFA